MSLQNQCSMIEKLFLSSIATAIQLGYSIPLGLYTTTAYTLHTN